MQSGRLRSHAAQVQRGEKGLTRLEGRLDLTVSAGSEHSKLAKPLLRPWMGNVFDAAHAPDPKTRNDRLISPAGPSDTTDPTGIAPALVIAAENDELARESYALIAKRVMNVLDQPATHEKWYEQCASAAAGT